ncbi:hypothetical protein KYLE_49 [Pantoea phage Kyle]|uniref:Uncharacterized protein n=1 Tax=Pantoea phage Kyle TaxID=2589665 RepID=A0A514A8M0_9CAUD|nr:hypothetical protein HWC52_gp049 [Pantoea phage Kyle]QDH49605.1 hypothetical protein KYLE_49 [Pantoea phage Kyle]
MNIIEVDVHGPDGTEKRRIKIHRMGAQEGWEAQRRFIEFAMSKDPAFRKEYTFEILAFASVVRDGSDDLPLNTPTLIENHLQNWRNLEKVFNAILMDNGIDPSTHAEKDHYWMNAGGEIAAAFIQQTIDMLGPLLKDAGKVTK